MVALGYGVVRLVVMATATTTVMMKAPCLIFCTFKNHRNVNTCMYMCVCRSRRVKVSRLCSVDSIG